MKEFANRFYKSKAWQRCRREYAKSAGGLCEECLRKGIITPGEIVHHKTKLTPDNINDPKITLGWDNLELLCRECHGLRHATRIKRYKVTKTGEIIMLD